MRKWWSLKGLVRTTTTAYFLGHACVGIANSEEPVQEKSSKGAYPMRATIRYTTPKGIGYQPGYTTVEGFFSPPCLLRDAYLPFLDLRGHVFDNGKLAANAGIGLRYLRNTRIWGVNAYYDYRNTSRQHYNQVSAGLESLGKHWDFRLNGYFPVGRKRSSYFDAQFETFQGHHMLLKLKRDSVLKGCNAEAGYHLTYFKQAPIDFALGPYYLTGSGKTTWGGEARVTADILTYLKVQGNLSYDHFFKWIAQAQVGINIPFGRRCKSKRVARPMALQALAKEQVYRHEIIPVRRQHLVAPAINPTTGDPWVFWFVDNTSHSLGTYESPFSTLVAAEQASASDEAIYVFPGDGMTTGMADGITLKDSQFLLGASVEHAIPTSTGFITIPSMALQPPKITNNNGTVVISANDNVISGFDIAIASGQSSSANGLYGDAISNLFINQNSFSTSTPAAQTCINLLNFSGQLVVDTCSFDGVGISILQGSIDNLQVSNNTFSSLSNVTGVNISHSQVNDFSISNNTFSDFSQGFAAGIHIDSAQVNDLGAFNNTFSNFSNGVYGIYGIYVNVLQAEIFRASNNVFSNFSGGDGIFVMSSSVTHFHASRNAFSNFSQAVGIALNLSSIAVSNVFNNTFSNFSGDTSAGIYIAQGGFSALFNNVFSNFSNSVSGIVSLLINTSDVQSLQISNSTFSGGDNAGNGFAANITVTHGSLCLDFFDNSASPTQDPTPYVLTQTGGTFDKTSRSDNSTNIGEFSLVGAIESVESCNP